MFSYILLEIPLSLAHEHDNLVEGIVFLPPRLFFNFPSRDTMEDWRETCNIPISFLLSANRIHGERNSNRERSDKRIIPVSKIERRSFNSLDFNSIRCWRKYRERDNYAIYHMINFYYNYIINLIYYSWIAIDRNYFLAHLVLEMKKARFLDLLSLWQLNSSGSSWIWTCFTILF